MITNGNSPVRRRAVSAAVMACALALAALGGLAACSSGEERPESPYIAEGLAEPHGLAVSEDGNLLIAETGFGRILEVTGGGDVEEVVTGLPTTLDSGPGSNYPAGPSAVIASDGELMILVGEFKGDRFGRLYRWREGGEPEPVTAPTSIDIPAEDRFANPYDFIEMPGGDGWLIADSGRNALVAVEGDGTTRDYALFEQYTVPARSTGVEMVPTGIAIGPDGAVYVGSLTGYPYPAGIATVWRVEDVNGDGDALDSGEVEPYIDGFTTITDIAFDSQGRLYVAEFTSDMMQVIEGGQVRQNSATFPGRVLRWDEAGGGPAPVVEGLTSPTGLLIHDGSLYVSEEFAGRVRRVALPE